MEKIQYIKNSFEELGLILSEEQYQQFLNYYEILIEWNQVMNLTGITEFNEVVKKHFVDSLSLINVIDMNKNYKVLDMGTGAGFPGIPLKIAFPQLDVVLMDSLNKRIKFLNAVIETLKLENICAIHGRAEEYARKELYRESFDLCVSRAVANLSTLSEYCIPYIKMGGYFISYKSGKVEEEVKNAEKAVKILGGKIKEKKIFYLPKSDISRCFIVVEKKKSTIKKYPRGGGKPSKEPL